MKMFKRLLLGLTMSLLASACVYRINIQQGNFLDQAAVEQVKAGMTRNIDITRALGVDNPPANVYITGTATEGGSDLSKALAFKQTASGKYEIYTSLAAGAYHFVSANSGTISGIDQGIAMGADRDFSLAKPK